MPQRPWPVWGVGWLAALIAAIIIILDLVGVTLPAHAIWWVAALLVVAFLLG